MELSLDERRTIYGSEVNRILAQIAEGTLIGKQDSAALDSLSRARDAYLLFGPLVESAVSNGKSESSLAEAIRARAQFALLMLYGTCLECASAGVSVAEVAREVALFASYSGVWNSPGQVGKRGFLLLGWVGQQNTPTPPVTFDKAEGGGKP